MKTSGCVDYRITIIYVYPKNTAVVVFGYILGPRPPAVVQVRLPGVAGGVQQSTCRTVLRDAQDLARTQARPSRGSWDGQTGAPTVKTWAGPYPGQQT